MKFSISLEPTFFEMYGEAVYEKLKEIGFNCLDYNMPFYDGDKPNPQIYNTNMKEFEKFFIDEKKKIEAAGLTVGQTHSPFHVYNSDKSVFDCRIEEIKYSIIATSILGVKYTVLHPAQPCWFEPDTNPQRTRDINFYLFEQLIPVAERYGVRLALENMPGEGVPTASPESLVDYIDMMKSDVMAACLDTGHANIAGENIVRFATMLGNRLAVLHLNDNCGRMDEHYIPYLGTIGGCWTEFMQALKKIGYTGTLNLESGTYISRLPAELRENALKMSYDVLKVLDKLQ